MLSRVLKDIFFSDQVHNIPESLGLQGWGNWNNYNSPIVNTIKQYRGTEFSYDHYCCLGGGQMKGANHNQVGYALTEQTK